MRIKNEVLVERSSSLSLVEGECYEVADAKIEGTVDVDWLTPSYSSEGLQLSGG